jgi:hypothetical protein
MNTTLSSISVRQALLLVIAAASLAGCGGNDSTGPEFGDLEFSPASPIEIGAARQVDLELFSLSDESLGPLVLGAGSIPLSFPPEFTCPGLEVLVAPNQISSLAGGASREVSVSFSFAGLTEQECPLATYEVDLNAALGATILGSAQIRLDHTALE